MMRLAHLVPLVAAVALVLAAGVPTCDQAVPLGSHVQRCPQRRPGGVVFAYALAEVPRDTGDQGGDGLDGDDGVSGADDARADEFEEGYGGDGSAWDEWGEADDVNGDSGVWDHGGDVDAGGDGGGADAGAGWEQSHSASTPELPRCVDVHSPPPAVGIDLGTTYSCVAVAVNNRVEVIPNELGNRITPSWVAFTQTSRLVGESAKNQASRNAANTVFDTKRLMGRSYRGVLPELQHLPYRVLERHTRPVIAVQYRGEQHEFAPEEVGAAILAKMRSVAESHLGCRVEDVVVTVPAYFNDAQRHATMAAGLIAGLNVRRVLNEPTAAVLAASLGGHLDLSDEEERDVPSGARDRDRQRRRRRRKKARRARGGGRGAKPSRKAHGRRSFKARRAAGGRRASAREDSDDGEAEERSLVLAFDLGGGTFDVSLLAVAGGVFEVLATAGDTRLGGEDFDRSLALHALRVFRDGRTAGNGAGGGWFGSDDDAGDEHVDELLDLTANGHVRVTADGVDGGDNTADSSGSDGSWSAYARWLGWGATWGGHEASSGGTGSSGQGGAARTMMRVLREANRVKHSLSSRFTASLEVPNIVPGGDLVVTVSRAKFEELITPQLRKALQLVKRVLADAGVTKKDVERVVLVGGSTRVPAVRRMLARRFGQGRVCAAVNPDEAVALGAAIQAGVLAGQRPSVLGPLSSAVPEAGATESRSPMDGKGMVLLDVTPLSLGIESTGGLFSVIVPRNTVIPTRRTRTYTTEVDNQPDIFVEVYQGERALTKHNALLGSFTLDDLPPAPRLVPKIDVTFRLDVDGMLSVTAHDKATGKSKSLVIRGHGRFGDGDIERMRRTAEMFAEQDKAEARRIEAFNALDSLLYSVRRHLDRFTSGELSQRLTDEEVQEVQEELANGDAWVSRSNARDLSSEEDTRARQRALTHVWDPLVRKLYDNARGQDEGL